MFRSVPVSHSSSRAPPGESGAASRRSVAASQARKWTTRMVNLHTDDIDDAVELVQHSLDRFCQ
jgi:hypothetical protein